jgi:hypothetical protein
MIPLFEHGVHKKEDRFLCTCPSSVRRCNQSAVTVFFRQSLARLDFAQGVPGNEM